MNEAKRYLILTMILQIVLLVRRSVISYNYVEDGFFQISNVKTAKICYQNKFE